MSNVDYVWRPARLVESALVAEVLHLLSGFHRMQDYQFVSTDTPEFARFQQFHELLGIKKMVNLVGDLDEDRFDANRPFKSIENWGGNTQELLRKRCDLSSPTIAWLQYERGLDQDALSDIGYLASSLATGSALIVTVAADPDATFDGQADRLVTRLGEAALPSLPTDRALVGWGTARFMRLAVDTRIRDMVARRNTGKPFAAQMHYGQLFNVQSHDDAKRLTVGGVLHDSPTRDAFNAMGRFPQVRPADSDLRIQIPPLTSTEIEHLRRQLPGEADDLELPGFENIDIASFSDVYRHYPTPPRFVR